MGNQLVGIAPSQIYPIEHYFEGSFESNLQYESSMGNTRFFKVARVRSDEGLLVVKVFVRHDPSLPLESHSDKIERITKLLGNCVNCLPFQRVVLTEKACLIMREYVKHSLYDRISTRPFLTVIEKKWVTFQILCALLQCHKQKVCHGDIKLENILLTSWNWVLLADFASFKPTYLPRDNPADYTYFFDTSRRRTCYIAPERFLKSQESPFENNSNKNNVMVDSIFDEDIHTARMQPEMDIFSAGCALIELWTDGNAAPLEYTQFILQKQNEDDLFGQHLSLIEDENLKSLLMSMLAVNPKKRKSAELLLDSQKGKLFPEYFYSFLQSFLQMFSSSPILMADEKISRLYADIEQIIKILTNGNDGDKDDNDGLIIMISVVTSCIRGLHYCETKTQCLEILRKLSVFSSSETILDRILPYILHLTHDNSPRVRITALHTLTSCLSKVKKLPKSDANIFPEYILPTIRPLATDPAVNVRVAFAEDISTLAQIAQQFLDQTLKDTSANDNDKAYDAEVNTLHSMIQEMISSILTDSESLVKQTLMESNIAKLCWFFGQERANDIIISHMITFLNDKEDKNLRGSFFETIFDAVSFVGWACSDILIPLLQQGLTDVEEYVIAKSIATTHIFIEFGLILKSGIALCIQECVSYLNHPNLWIRHEICGLISKAAKILRPIEVQCKIMPLISNYLKTQIIQLEKPEILMNCLQPPIPRNIYDELIRYSKIQEFFNLIHERRKYRVVSSESFLQKFSDVPPDMKVFFRRLLEKGMNELVEKQILSMERHIIKINKYRSVEKSPSFNGNIMINNAKIKTFEYTLHDQKQNKGNERHTKKSDDNIHVDFILDLNEGAQGNDTPSAGSDINLNQPQGHTDVGSSLAEYSMPEKNSILEKSSSCYNSLEELKLKTKTYFQSLLSNRTSSETYYSSIPKNWKLNGTLAAHLHEHKKTITKLTSMTPFGSLFVSSSIDGTLRLWDANKLDGRTSINRSRQVYITQSPIHAIASCDSGQSLAVGGKDGSIMLLRIDPSSSKMALQQVKQMSSNDIDDGPIIDMHALNNGHRNVVVYSTLYGSIIGWDIRMPHKNAWRLKQPLQNGTITTFCIDLSNSWLATGTNSGTHICWDLRFRLPIAELKNPSKRRICKLLHHPTEPSRLISSAKGNNEISIWDIETGQIESSLWASNHPPLSHQTNSDSVYGMLTGITNKAPFIMSAGTDQRIRYWDLLEASRCSVVVSTIKDVQSETSFTYDSRLIDGTSVIYETRLDTGTNVRSGSSSARFNSDDLGPRSGPNSPAPEHNDAITDLLFCKTSKQSFVVSSGRDGVIKLWK